MDITEIRALSETELAAKRKDARQELFNLEQQKRMGQLEKPSRVQEVRKDAAKIETVLSERRLGLKVQSRKPSKKAEKAKK